MSESNIVLPTLTSGQVMILWLVLVSALVALAYGVVLIRVVLAADPGPKSMTDVSDAIELGAMAYLGRQVKTMIWFVAAIFIALFLMYRNVYQGLYLPLGISIAFLMGVAASYGAGYVGMWLAVKGNVRSANAALTSFKDAMELAVKAGGGSGMFTIVLGLLGAPGIRLHRRLRPIRGRVRGQADHVRPHPAGRRRVFFDHRDHGGARPGRQDARSDAPDQHRLHDLRNRICDRIFRRQLFLSRRSAHRRDRLALRMLRVAGNYSRRSNPMADQLFHPSRQRPRHGNRDGRAHRPGHPHPVRDGRRARVLSMGAASHRRRDHRRDAHLPRIPSPTILRHSPNRPGPPNHHRLHLSDGHLRTHHRQRPRHFRDGRYSSGRSLQDALLDGRYRQHDQSPDQGTG